MTQEVVVVCTFTFAAAASSLRSQVAVRAARAAARVGWSRPSVSVCWRPPLPWRLSLTSSFGRSLCPRANLRIGRYSHESAAALAAAQQIAVGGQHHLAAVAGR